VNARLLAPICAAFLLALAPSCTCSDTRQAYRNVDRSSDGAAFAISDANADRATTSNDAATDPRGASVEPEVHVWRSTSLAAVVLSPGGSRGKRSPLPVLFVFHGRGEALKGKELGMYGWANDYELKGAFARMYAPPLREDDFYGFVSQERLREVNTALQGQPFREMVIVCPFLPNFSLQAFEEVRPYAAQFKKEFVDHLENLEQVVGAPIDRARISIDGVSLGGLASLWIGSEYPTTFAALGALQPALFSRDVGFWSARLAKARSVAPALSIRLVTSEEDFYRGAVEALTKTMTSKGIAHEFFLAKGPHDYVFNRGPGAYELLFWHERTLYSR
jgi:hypothetical protein